MTFGHPNDEDRALVTIIISIFEIKKKVFLKGCTEKLKGLPLAAVNLWHCFFRDCVEASPQVRISSCVCWYYYCSGLIDVHLAWVSAEELSEE
jgi:hypothetical protein